MIPGGGIGAAIVERFGWVLVHSLWQFFVIGLVAFALRRALRRAGAAVRYFAMLGTFSLAIVAPLVTWMILTEEVLENSQPLREVDEVVTVAESVPHVLEKSIVEINDGSPTQLEIP